MAYIERQFRTFDIIQDFFNRVDIDFVDSSKEEILYLHDTSKFKFGNYELGQPFIVSMNEIKCMKSEVALGSLIHESIHLMAGRPSWDPTKTNDSFSFLDEILAYTKCHTREWWKIKNLRGNLAFEDVTYTEFGWFLQEHLKIIDDVNYCYYNNPNNPVSSLEVTINVVPFVRNDNYDLEYFKLMGLWDGAIHRLNASKILAKIKSGIEIERKMQAPSRIANNSLFSDPKIWLGLSKISVDHNQIHFMTQNSYPQPTQGN